MHLPLTPFALALALVGTGLAAPAAWADETPVGSAQDSANQRAWPWVGGGVGPLDALILDVEAGPLAVLRNEERYGASGTGFNAALAGQQRNLAVANRISAEARWGNNRHAAILLWAPFDLNTRVTLPSAINFRDTIFAQGSVVDMRFLFEGFRASYLYEIAHGANWQAEGGATLQIRNAQVALAAADGTRYASESDIGLVPALKGRLRYQFPTGMYTVLEADGLTTFGLLGPTGGILDGVVALGAPLRPGLNGELRLRWVTGGANVPSRDISSWADFVSATAGLRWTIGGRNAEP